MLIRQNHDGFSLLELMVAIAIFAILYLLAMPSFTTAIQNGQIRTAAQSIVSGIQLARAEAVRRNTYVQFNLINSLGGNAVAGGSDWTIYADGQSTPGTPSYTILVQQRSGLEGSNNVLIGTKTANNFASAAAAGAGLPGAITFTSLGRVTPTTGISPTTIRQIDVFNNVVASARRLSITITPGGQIRLCDPALSIATNPQGCV